MVTRKAKLLWMTSHY